VDRQTDGEADTGFSLLTQTRLTRLHVVGSGGVAVWACIFTVYDDIVKRLIRNVVVYPPDHIESHPRKHEKSSKRINEVTDSIKGREFRD
jgi:predicted metal-dependent phosphoesterase TrpH